jgi:hypothetical protein
VKLMKAAAMELHPRTIAGGEGAHKTPATDTISTNSLLPGLGTLSGAGASEGDRSCYYKR